MRPAPLILGIESSCDETAASVVAAGTHVLSNVIATQHELHERYAGVVPEIASRAHLERIMPVVDEALRVADVALTDLDAVAVGHRPGLIGSLLVGVSAGKALAWTLGLPIIGVDHVHAHLYAAQLDEARRCAFPALGLVVSGGHTALYTLSDFLEVTKRGHTIDDAVGEAFDKAATILKLGYPGGPRIDALAQEGRDDAVELPIASLTGYDFSFSGLKTALLYAVRGQPVGRGRASRFPRDADDHDDAAKADFAASFQRAAVTAVMRKLRRLRKDTPDARTLLVGGGVTANSRLRAELTSFADAEGLDLRLPPLDRCLDNAAMLAGLAAHRFDRGEADDFSLSPSTRSML